MSMTALPNIPASAPIVAVTPLLTAEEFFQRHGQRQAELVKGLVRELPMPTTEHGALCAEFARLLGNFIIERQMGRVLSNDTSVLIRRNPDTVYGPDVCYVSYARLPKGKLPHGMLTVLPELVVEVRSPSDTWTSIFGKIGDYLAAGVGLIVVLDPETQTATVYRPDALQTIFRRDQELVLPELLPGFAVSLAKLFEG